jgi:hypothetical protein
MSQQKSDEPSSAKAEEAKPSGSSKKSSDSGSESGDDEYVKIEKISAEETQEALAQSEVSVLKICSLHF